MAEWKTVLLGNICKTNTNSYSNKDGWEFVNYLDTGNITVNDIGEIQYIDLNEDKLPSRAKRKVKFNSIIYSTVRPNQLHYGIIKEQPENFLVSTGFTVIDVDETVADADFIYYWLTKSTLTDQLQSIAEQSVSTYPSIKPSDLEGLEIELPPLDVQKKIAGILLSLDNKRKTNASINRNLEEQANIFYEKWKEKLSGELAELSTVIDVRDGTHDSPKAQDEGYPLVTSKHLKGYDVDLQTPNLISEEDYIKINDRSKVDQYDVLMSMIGTIGLVSFVSRSEINFAIKNVALFKTSKKKEFIYYFLMYLKSKETMQNIEMLLSGTLI